MINVCAYEMFVRQNTQEMCLCRICNLYLVFTYVYYRAYLRPSEIIFPGGAAASVGLLWKWQMGRIISRDKYKPELVIFRVLAKVRR